MELLNIGFALLVVKIAVSVLPAALGIFLLTSSEEKKREMRNSLCNKLFGVSNAIPYPNFARFLIFMGFLLIAFSATASWFLVLSKMLSAQ